MNTLTRKDFYFDILLINWVWSLGRKGKKRDVLQNWWNTVQTILANEYPKCDRKTFRNHQCAQNCIVTITISYHKYTGSLHVSLATLPWTQKPHTCLNNLYFPLWLKGQCILAVLSGSHLNLTLSIFGKHYQDWENHKSSNRKRKVQKQLQLHQLEDVNNIEGEFSFSITVKCNYTSKVQQSNLASLIHPHL